mgnify:CR=1 FL=1
MTILYVFVHFDERSEEKFLIKSNFFSLRQSFISTSLFRAADWWIHFSYHTIVTGNLRKR